MNIPTFAIAQHQIGALAVLLLGSATAYLPVEGGARFFVKPFIKLSE